jgi:hypothetical protein
MRRLAIFVALAGCGYDGPWALRVALGEQAISRGDIGLSNQAAISVGDLWVSARSSLGDTAYPVVPGAGDQLVVTSAFQPTITPYDEPRDALVTWTLLAKDSNQTSATVYLDVQLDVAQRGEATGPLASGVASLELDLDVPVPAPCELPTAVLGGSVRGCLATCAADVTTPLVHLDDGSYAAGPFRVWLQLVPDECLE